MIGTPFNIKDEIMQRRIQGLDKKPWEQEGRDDQGRKHFYGAFTGALKEFSVGYKGTVGSKEGFQPKQFVSSRSEKKGTQFQQQSIFEFMDEDDMGEHTAGQTFQATQQYSDTLNSQQKDLLKSGISGDIQNNTFIPDELVVTTNNSKGYQLMRAMGFKDRGSSKYCFNHYEDSPEESEDDMQQQQDAFDHLGFMIPQKRQRQKEQKGKKYYDGPIGFKNNLFGIGFVPTRSDLDEIYYIKIIYEIDPDAAEQRQKKQQNRIKMSEFDYAGIEVDEDDDSVQQISNVYDTQKDKSKMYKDSIELDDEELDYCRIIVNPVNISLFSNIKLDNQGFLKKLNRIMC